MVRLKPSERRLLEEKAKQRAMKPTQLAYEAIISAISARYSIDEICDAISEYGSEIDALKRRLAKFEPHEEPND